MSELTLAALLSPIAVDAFMERYWGRKPLIVRRQAPHLYACLPDSEEFAFLLHSLTDPERGWFSIVNGVARPPSDSLLTQEGLLNLSEVYAAYRDGNSLLMNQVQRRHRETAMLCRRIESALSAHGIALARHIGANGYLSPPSSQGFNIHYDPHDVLILQIEGRKHWRLYGRHVAWPTQPPATPIPPEEAGSPRREFVLSPGELVYIPRGVLHDANTTDSRSLHLTLSIETLTWTDLLIEAMSDNPAFRRNLPVCPPFGKRIGDEARAELTRLTASLNNPRALRRALAAMSGRLLGNLDPLPNGGFAEVDGLHLIEPKTWLSLAPGTFGHVEVNGDEAILHLPGSALRAAREMAKAFYYLLRARRVRACDLPVSASEADKLTFVRKLVQMGFLVKASE
ncbi:cupin domain-containing protein [Burkholderia thailandensis]|uniref:cupin domain-containing protein n=1 Tax=Burkholderia thailandensis TaxID=57975 RepID=UPI002D7972DF|nr:cupin domain-containing protein [Burkholderia thailandensis]WRS68223.1 cupin domain-containing protein [Burkholderia thailandensis]